MLPEFYDRRRVGELHLERTALVAEQAAAFRDEHRIAPGDDDSRRVAAFGIDCQVDFCLPGGSLYVPGAVEDTTRTIEWLLRNVGRITDLFFSLDTHSAWQIFHPAWWVDAAGKHPEPFTTIRAADVRSGRYRALRQAAESLEYCEKLEASGRYVLTVWPYHTLEGGVGRALVPALFEAAVFHAVARRRAPIFQSKGTHPLTESYSVLAPEVLEIAGSSVGGFDDALFARLMSYDRVYVFGQAKSHCVLSTLRDLRERIVSRDPSLAAKVWILRDAMSPVPPPPLDPLPPDLDFPALADENVEQCRRAGMRVVSTTETVDATES